ncbi:MAG: hypothetical protein V7646_2140 [Pseudonocardia sp.]
MLEGLGVDRDAVAAAPAAQVVVVTGLGAVAAEHGPVLGAGPVDVAGVGIGAEGTVDGGQPDPVPPGGEPGV